MKGQDGQRWRACLGPRARVEVGERTEDARPPQVQAERQDGKTGKEQKVPQLSLSLGCGAGEGSTRAARELAASQQKSELPRARRTTPTLAPYPLLVPWHLLFAGHDSQ